MSEYNIKHPFAGPPVGQPFFTEQDFLPPSHPIQLEHVPYWAAAEANAKIQPLIEENERLKVRLNQQVYECDRTAKERNIAESRLAANQVHTCHANCTKAGCVNGRLRELLAKARHAFAQHVHNSLLEIAAYDLGKEIDEALKE